MWQKELQTLERKLKRQLKQLTKTVFACRPDACEALIAFQEQLEKHQLVKVTIETVRTKREPGQPRTQTLKTPIDGYRIKATLECKKRDRRETDSTTQSICTGPRTSLIPSNGLLKSY